MLMLLKKGSLLRHVLVLASSDALFTKGRYSFLLGSGVNWRSKAGLVVGGSIINTSASRSNFSKLR